MKKLTFIILLIFASIEIYPQGLLQGSGSSIWFNSPTNGETIAATAYGSTQTTIPVNLLFNQNASSSYGYYIKLFPTPYTTQQSNLGNGIDQWWYLPIGSYTWKLELWEYNLQGISYKTAEQTITFYVKHTITIANNFNGGNINIDGNTGLSGSHVYKITGDNLLVGAIDQTYGSYYYIWNQSGINNSEWQQQKMGELNFSTINGSNSRNFNYTVASNDNGAKIQGALRKVCNITFQNSFVNVGNNGVIKVNGTQYNSPGSGFMVHEGNPITGEAINGTSGQIFNYIHYYFDHWSDGSTYYSKTFNPEIHGTYTAYFKGYPYPDDINFGWDYSVDHPIKFHWTDNPNTNVNQYQIWRIIKHNGVLGDPELLTSVGRGVQTYTDHTYGFTNGYTDDLLWYDVRQYYSVEQTYSEICWHPVYGEYLPKENQQYFANSSEISDYDLGCYPNPFNPTTKIQYQIPLNGMVSIKVYDMLGREIKTLLNEYKEIGKYEINFDASKLPSGVYLYMLKSNDFISVKKMMLAR